MEYKKVYTPEELHEIKTWYQEHMEELPPSLELNAATNIKDLKKTIGAYFEMLNMHHENPTYGAQIHHLFKIRERLIELGLFS